MDVAQMILDSCTSSDTLTEMINALKQAAIIDQNLEEISELDLRLIRFGEIDRNSDLAWFNYQDWNRLSFGFQAFWVDYLEILKYTGVFFSWEEFLTNEDLFCSFIKDLNEDFSITVIVEGRTRKRFVVNSITSSEIDLIKHNEFKDLNDKLSNATIIKSYSIINNNLVASGN